MQNKFLCLFLPLSIKDITQCVIYCKMGKTDFQYLIWTSMKRVLFENYYNKQIQERSEINENGYFPFTVNYYYIFYKQSAFTDGFAVCLVVYVNNFLALITFLVIKKSRETY